MKALAAIMERGKWSDKDVRKVTERRGRSKKNPSFAIVANDNGINKFAQMVASFRQRMPTPEEAKALIELGKGLSGVESALKPLTRVTLDIKDRADALAFLRSGVLRASIKTEQRRLGAAVRHARKEARHTAQINYFRRCHGFAPLAA